MDGWMDGWMDGALRNGAEISQDARIVRSRVEAMPSWRTVH